MSTDNHQQPKTSPNAGGDKLVEYKVQGLSCPNCTREMQEEIQKLDHGGDARLSYNSGKLTLSPGEPKPGRNHFEK